MQQSEWVSLGINPDFGRSVIEQIDTMGDEEARNACHVFMHTSQAVYLQALNDRRPESLETEATMPLEKVLEFLDACNMAMETPETQKRLLEYMKDHKKMPSELIIDMQKDMLEVFGYEREHGCMCLMEIQNERPDDQELAKQFEKWHNVARMACLRSVQAFEARGGKLPGSSQQVSPKLQALQKQATEELDLMTPLERGIFLDSFEEKFASLPNMSTLESMSKYMSQLDDGEKVELIKAQILARSLCEGMSCPSHHHTVPNHPPNRAPLQQEMQ